jgi:hypothetical protein
MTSVLATGAHNLLEQGPSSSMITMDNRVGEGKGGVAATYCIDYRVAVSPELVTIKSSKSKAKIWLA